MMRVGGRPIHIGAVHAKARAEREVGKQLGPQQHEEKPKPKPVFCRRRKKEKSLLRSVRSGTVFLFFGEFDEKFEIKLKIFIFIFNFNNF
jgi:hypothetical protein